MSSSATQRGGAWLREWAWVILPVAAALAAHGPALACGFVWDDVALLVRNPHLGEPGFVGRLFMRDYGLDYAGRAVGYYRPLLVLVATLIRRVFGTSPVPFHAFGLAALCLCTALLTWAARRFTGHRGLACLTGAFYAVHPARTEVAALFTSSPDLLMDGFMTAMLLLIGVRAARAWRRGWALAALAFLAALSKESAFFMVPALAATLLAHALFRRVSWRAHATFALMLAAGLGAGCVMRALAGIPAQGMMLRYPTALFGYGAGRAWQTLATAAGNVFLPDLAIFAESPEVPNTAWAVALVAAALWGWGLLWLRLARCERPEAALVAAWVGAALVNLMFIRTACVPYSERYIPMGGVALGLCLAADGGWQRLRTMAPARPPSLWLRLAGLVGLLMFLGAMGVCTFVSTWQCRAPTAFFSAMVERDPDSVVGHIGLAQELSQADGSAGEMDSHVQVVARVVPRHRELGGLWIMVARRYMDEGRYRLALNRLDRVPAGDSGAADALALKAAALAYEGDFVGAVAAIERALAEKPDHLDYRRLAAEIRRDAASAAVRLDNGATIP